jgi:N-acetyl-alpha-D-glucosaminyl L-malate synthase BshA
VNIGIVCYASVGGSGIIATELGKGLAARGHRVHILSADTPVRLTDYQPGLSFHRVETPTYTLFREPQYLLSLTNKIVQVSRDERLDIVHAHYAIPHATAGYLARQILASVNGNPAPRVITTLHGTDITLLGGDPSYKETVAFCIDQSDGVTAVSESLKADTYLHLGVRSDIRVIPNFLDDTWNRRREIRGLRLQLAPAGQAVFIHVSNFRPVKRAPMVVEIFARARQQVPAKLLMVGDGPDMAEAVRLSRQLKVADDVAFLGVQEQVVPLLSVADAFILPSSQESFGLAALEALACEVPVIASRVGGLPEVIEDGVNGFLHAPDDLEGMAASAVQLATNPARQSEMAAAARRIAQERFSESRIVPRYEEYYAEVMAGQPRGYTPS